MEYTSFTNIVRFQQNVLQKYWSNLDTFKWKHLT